MGVGGFWALPRASDPQLEHASCTHDFGPLAHPWPSQLADEYFHVLAGPSQTGDWPSYAKRGSLQSALCPFRHAIRLSQL